MRSFWSTAVLGASLLLAACSGADPDPPVEPPDLPELPPGVELLDDAALESQLEAVQGAISQTTGTSVTWEAVFDVTDGGLEEVVTHYDEALTAQGWAEADGLTDITDPLGTSWRREGRSVVLISLRDFEDRDLAILLAPPQEES